jgi:hypothetical protein
MRIISQAEINHVGVTSLCSSSLFEVSYSTSIEIFRKTSFSSRNASDSPHVSIRHVPQVKPIPGLVTPNASAMLLRMRTAIHTSLDLYIFTFVRVSSRPCSEHQKKGDVRSPVGSCLCSALHYRHRLLHFSPALITRSRFICDKNMFRRRKSKLVKRKKSQP